MLLACWAVGAQPEDLLVAPQGDLVREVARLNIPLVVPLSQQWMLACRKGRLPLELELG